MMFADKSVSQYDALQSCGLEFDVRVDCPKCGSTSAWYTKDRYDVTLRCLCGYHKVVATLLQDTVIEHIDSGDDVSLPKRGTKLWVCLVALHRLAPARTSDIVLAINDVQVPPYTPKEVASQLTVLRYKGLVKVIDDRRGIPGGSTWELTAPCAELLGVTEWL